MHRLFTLILLFAVSASAVPAWANFDSDCAEQLRGKWTKPMREHWDLWQDRLQHHLKMPNHPSVLEYEAVMDSAHGLRLNARFANGEEVLLDETPESIVALRARLPFVRMIDVDYSLQAQRELGRVFKVACIVLGRPACRDYDRFAGFDQKNKRPFTTTEEQALKWAMWHIAPNPGILRFYKDSGVSEAFVLDRQATYEDKTLDESRTFLNSAFAKEDAAILWEDVTAPALKKKFADILALYHQTKE